MTNIHGKNMFRHTVMGCCHMNNGGGVIILEHNPFFNAQRNY